MNNLTKQQCLSKRIQTKAQDTCIGLSPQMKLLVDMIGKEIECELDHDYTPDKLRIKLILSVYDLLHDENTADEFHDTSDTNPDNTVE